MDEGDGRGAQEGHEGALHLRFRNLRKRLEQDGRSRSVAHRTAGACLLLRVRRRRSGAVRQVWLRRSDLRLFGSSADQHPRIGDARLPCPSVRLPLGRERLARRARAGVRRLHGSSREPLGRVCGDAHRQQLRLHHRRYGQRRQSGLSDHQGARCGGKSRCAFGPHRGHGARNPSRRYGQDLRVLRHARRAGQQAPCGGRCRRVDDAAFAGLYAGGSARQGCGERLLQPPACLSAPARGHLHHEFIKN